MSLHLEAPLRTLARPRPPRRRGGSLVAAAAQVGLALVIALGSIGLASVATLVAPGGASPEQFVAGTAARAMPAPPARTTPSADDRAGAQDGASPRPIPRR